MTVRTCKICDCSGKHYGLGLCSKHYYRQWKHGSPTAGGKPRPKRGSVFDWLLAHTDFSSDDCLIWPFSRKDNGYGQMTYKGRPARAHRVMCELVNGPPRDESLDCAHKCGNGHLGCVNPRHLRWATRKENMSDAMEHGTVRRGSKQPNAVLTEQQVIKMRTLHSQGVSNTDLSVEFGVSRPTVTAVLQRRSWDWLSDRFQE